MALENVRCEELQIELSSVLKAKAARSAAAAAERAASSCIPSGTSSTVTWAPTISHQDQGSEIDIIMAKIEQARLSIANVCLFLSM